jgi:hypothetical protein
MSFQSKPAESNIDLTSQPAKQFRSILSPSPCLIPSDALLSVCAGHWQEY